MKCKCGNNKFYAHQQLYVDVIVDGDNNFIENTKKTIEESMYEASKPYGTYACTKCGKTYENLE